MLIVCVLPILLLTIGPVISRPQSFHEYSKNSCGYDVSDFINLLLSHLLYNISISIEKQIFIFSHVIPQEAIS